MNKILLISNILCALLLITVNANLDKEDEIPKNVCELKAETGICKAKIQRYFFNSKSKKCEKFVYGGCGGNGNNFKTKAECELRCGSSKNSLDENPFLKQINIGRCVSERVNLTCEKDNLIVIQSIQVTFKSSKCPVFGKQYTCSNEVYKSKLEALKKTCQNKKSCLLDISKFLRDCGTSTYINFDFLCSVVPIDTASGTHVYFRVDNVDKCKLNAEPGPCKASKTSYFYNSTSQKCEQFVYGGCGGNGNNFDIIEECMKQCKPICPKIKCGCKNGEQLVNFIDSKGCPSCKCVSKNVCELKAETGECKARMPMYYFDSKQKKCLKFIYGGCGGNGNKFKTIEDCNKKCNPRICPDIECDCMEGYKLVYKNDSNNCEICSCEEEISKNVCQLKAETGICKAKIQRYFFNSKSKKCEKFVYGGCGGNENNFKTKAECEFRCGSSYN